MPNPIRVSALRKLFNPSITRRELFRKSGREIQQGIKGRSMSKKRAAHAVHKYTSKSHGASEPYTFIADAVKEISNLLAFRGTYDLSSPQKAFVAIEGLGFQTFMKTKGVGLSKEVREYSKEIRKAYPWLKVSDIKRLVALERRDPSMSGDLAQYEYFTLRYLQHYPMSKLDMLKGVRRAKGWDDFPKDAEASAYLQEKESVELAIERLGLSWDKQGNPNPSKVLTRIKKTADKALQAMGEAAQPIVKAITEGLGHKKLSRRQFLGLGWKKPAVVGGAVTAGVSLNQEAEAMPPGIFQPVKKAVTGAISSTLERLKGKTVKGRVIKDVRKRGNWRNIIFEDGTEQIVTKAQLHHLAVGKGRQSYVEKFREVNEEAKTIQAMKSLQIRESRARNQPYMTRAGSRDISRRVEKDIKRYNMEGIPDSVFVHRGNKFFQMPKEYAEHLESLGVLKIASPKPKKAVLRSLKPDRLQGIKRGKKFYELADPQSVQQDVLHGKQVTIDDLWKHIIKDLVGKHGVPMNKMRDLQKFSKGYSPMDSSDLDAAFAGIADYPSLGLEKEAILARKVLRKAGLTQAGKQADRGYTRQLVPDKAEKKVLKHKTRTRQEVEGVANYFNTMHGEHQIRYDGAYDLTVLNKPPVYQFTAQEGPAKGASFSVEQPTYDAVKKQLDHMIRIRKK